MGSPQFYSRTDEFARRLISISVASFTTQSKLLSQQRVYSPVVDELLGSTVRFRNWRVHDRTLYPSCWPSEINVPALADSRQTELSAYQGTDKPGLDGYAVWRYAKWRNRRIRWHCGAKRIRSSSGRSSPRTHLWTGPRNWG